MEKKTGTPIASANALGCVKVGSGLSISQDGTLKSSAPSVVESLVQTKSSTASGGENVWTATFNGGQTSTLTVLNGQKGDVGEIAEEKAEREAADSAIKDDLSSEQAARTNADTTLDELKADKTSLVQTNRSLAALWKLNKGQTWDYETDADSAREKVIPIGAKYVDLLKVGGMKLKVDGATDLISADVDRVEVSDSDGTVTGTYTISDSIKALDGYGWGISSECYNYIDFERKVFVKNVGRVDLGTLTPKYVTEWGTGQEAFMYNSLLKATPSDYAPASAVLVSKFGYVGEVAQWKKVNDYGDKSIATVNAGTEYGFIIKDTDYTSASAFKSAMSGVYLYYELATPVETDISAMLTDGYNGIECESGGNVAMRYDGDDAYDVDVPNELEYIVKLDEVN